MDELSAFASTRRRLRHAPTHSPTSTSSTSLSDDATRPNTVNSSKELPRLSPPYQAFWSAHSARTKKRGGYTNAQGEFISNSGIESHAQVKAYCNWMHSVYECLDRWNKFEENNKDLPLQIIDLQSLKISEALLVVDEQLSGDSGPREDYVDFIVGSTGRWSKLNIKPKLRTSLEAHLIERSAEWNLEGADKIRVILGTAMPAAKRIITPIPASRRIPSIIAMKRLSNRLSGQLGKSDSDSDSYRTTQGSSQPQKNTILVPETEKPTEVEVPEAVVEVTLEEGDTEAKKALPSRPKSAESGKQKTKRTSLFSLPEEATEKVGSRVPEVEKELYEESADAAEGNVEAQRQVVPGEL